MPSFKNRMVVSLVSAFIAGGANAQSCVMAGGEPLRTSDGQCVRTASSTASAPAPKEISYRTEVLFAFDDDVLTPDARKRLDALAQNLVAMEVEKVVAVGHADGVGPAPYNRRLSARRAKAVGDYLAGKGVPGERLELVAMGEHDPLTAGACDVMAGLQGPSEAKLIQCLQPDRRVRVELTGRPKSGR
jgi:OOP family OmpA-OmpF porin